tara:strand:+ start:971 stop:1189 length:219 start_codon:yes stop_codon:yes gene_type:complete
MKIKEVREHALVEININPGLTRMEWFAVCNRRLAMLGHKISWHSFKFNIVQQLVVDGKVNNEDEFFWPAGME